MGALSVAGGSDLLLGSLSESNAEHSKQVSVRGLGLHECLNSGVPLLNNGAQLVPGNVHSVEVCVAIEALNFFDLQFHLSPGLLIIASVQIGQRYFEHTTFQAVGGDL